METGLAQEDLSQDLKKSYEIAFELFQQKKVNDH